MTHAYLNDLSILFLGSAVSLLISGFRNETVDQRYNIGTIMLVASFVLYLIAT